MERTAAAAAAKAQRADLAKMQKGILSDAEAQEAAQLELVKRANKQKIQELADAKDAAKAAAAAKAEAERMAADAAKQAARAAAEAQKQAVREAAAATKQAAKDKAQAEKEAGAAAAQAAKEAAAQQKEQTKAYEETRSSIDGMAKGMASFVGSMAGLDGAKAIVSALVDQFERGVVTLQRQGEWAVKYRDDLLELAALKGKLGQTTPILKEELDFRAATLLERDAAKQFEMIALGAGEAGIDKPGRPQFITQEEFNKGLVLGGKFAATEHGDPTAHGQLMGILPQLIGKRTTGKEVLAHEAQIFNIMKPGGPEFSSLVKQFVEQAPLIQSGIYKEMEAAALIGAFSTTKIGSGMAGTALDQFTRATLGGIGRTGKAKVEGAEAQGKYLKGLGITSESVKQIESTQLPFVIGKAISEDITRQEKAATAKGEKFSELDYMRQHGFVNQEDLFTLLQFRGLLKNGVLENTFLPLAQPGAMPNPEALIKQIDERQARGPEFKERRAQIAAETADVTKGVGQAEYLNALKKGALARLVDRGELKGYMASEDFKRVSQLSMFTLEEALFGPRRAMEAEAQRMLEAEAARLGIMKPGKQLGTFQGDEALFALSEKIRAKGGSDLPGLEPIGQSLAAKTAAQERSENLGLAPELPAPVLPAAMIPAPPAKPGADALASDPKAAALLAQAQAAGNGPQALPLYQRIAAEFPGTKEGTMADQKLALLRRNEAAQKLIGKAALASKHGQGVAASDLYAQVAKDFGDTPAADFARQQLGMAGPQAAGGGAPGQAAGGAPGAGMTRDQGDQMLDQLQQLNRNLQPRPLAPDPQPARGRPPAMAR